MMSLFHQISQHCSRHTTEVYSTSFASAIKLLHQELRQPVFNIYGFVRLADEIVDTFHGYDKPKLMARFREDTWLAIRDGISLNPVLHSFQQTVNRYGIAPALIEAFFTSMEMDLHKQYYSDEQYRQYIYGSAEVVGLMCLTVFCEGDQEQYARLQPHAQSLGAAFQKVNFLRDMKADAQQLQRIYFPGVDLHQLRPADKEAIEQDIEADFTHAFEGILQLPWKARFGVYVAYKYYYSLFNKIRRTEAARILEERIRIPNFYKWLILLRAGVKNQLRMI
ncbi:MAG: phytoene/squalene synthase family protein [Candidatus Pseudobacter hemicellulosilyticus]|uniref:Phytoene/squalene synthase family protein n=1 Tax=Candidatus Pseudobacter hemicellulosilyticus TaxID=3121375 RepID=A0AAJ6BIQ8_9BACT|nr:MAG: phytoene/squalene synthase family protein [Pseudobacter sp.]